MLQTDILMHAWLTSCLTLRFALGVFVQERPYPRRPADMPTFPTADTPGSSTHQHAAVQHQQKKQQMAEYVEAAYAAAGMPPPNRPAYDSGYGGGYGTAAEYSGLDHSSAYEIPETLYQRYDMGREGNAAAASAEMAAAAGASLKRQRPA